MFKEGHKVDLNTIVAIRNTITLICFVILAIIFHNFWIVFGSLLFWCWTEDKNS